MGYNLTKFEFLVLERLELVDQINDDGWWNPSYNYDDWRIACKTLVSMGLACENQEMGFGIIGAGRQFLSKQRGIMLGLENK